MAGMFYLKLELFLLNSLTYQKSNFWKLLAPVIDFLLTFSALPTAHMPKSWSPPYISWFRQPLPSFSFPILPTASFHIHSPGPGTMHILHEIVSLQAAVPLLSERLSLIKQTNSYLHDSYSCDGKHWRSNSFLSMGQLLSTLVLFSVHRTENKVEVMLFSVSNVTLSLNLTLTVTLTDPWMENSLQCN